MTQVFDIHALIAYLHDLEADLKAKKAAALKLVIIDSFAAIVGPNIGGQNQGGDVCVCLLLNLDGSKKK